MNELDLSLFGDVLVKPSTGEKALPEDVLVDKVLLLYFGAHWQPACNKFTPKLHFFNQLGDKEDFEIVFCSMDRSKEEYDQYSEQMPWWCLPYAISTLPLLAAKYHAHGLPHLVVIDSDGKLITREGVVSLSKDPLGGNFPWRPSPIVSLLPEYYLTEDDEGEALMPMDGLDEKYIMLYFSANHDEMSQEFKPWLLKAYKILKERRPNDFELLFVSGDKDEKGFYKFRADTKLPAIAFEEKQARKMLKERLDVSEYPALLMLGPKPADDDMDNLTGGDRPVINSEVQAVIENGDYITDFPYYPKPYGDLCKTTDDINTHKCLIVFHEMSDEEEQYDIEDAIKDAAQEYRDDEIIKFYWAFKSEAPLAMNIRQACRLGSLRHEPTMVLLDIPNDGAFYVSQEVNISMETILFFLVNKGERLQI